MVWLSRPHPLPTISVLLVHFASKFDRNDSEGFRPLNVVKLLTIVPIQRASLVNIAHLLIDNSYILFYWFSSSSSESDEHALSLRQLRFPSTIGLM
jgi:hypothetical protein